MALLYAAVEARSHFPRFPNVRALTIDHGLRADGAAEAHRVGRVCATMDVYHRTVTADLPPPHSAIQEWARNVRLDAFRQCKGIVLTAHTLNDEAETAVMRRQRGTSDHPGIAPLVWLHGTLHGTWLHRPFLTVRREALREWLRERRIGWIEDPSNADYRFERARIRKSLSRQPDAIERLASEARAASALRERGARAAAKIMTGVVCGESGSFDLPLPNGELTRDAGFMLAVRAICGHVGAHGNLPSAELIATALSAMHNNASASAARCVLRRTRDGIAVGREHRRGAPPPPPPALHPWPSHVPSHDLPLANALYRVAGQPPIPEPPVTIGRT